MDVICCITMILTARHFCEGFPIRLWPTNTRGTEGFVEAYYGGSWGFVGNPVQRFTDSTAVFLCKTLGLSEFGYGSGWTSIDNYTGHSWLYELECQGNETDIEQCSFNFEYNEYTNQPHWDHRYGSRLYCVDSRLKNGLTQNTGIIETILSGKNYTHCYDGFDMHAANVLCNHLRYNGAVNFTRITPNTTPTFNRSLLCNGNEYSLTECNRSDVEIVNCSGTVYVTCKAVRFTHWNEYSDEGAVEVYYNGSWGFVGSPGFAFDNVTSSFLCKTFGFPHGGFSTTAHPLPTYNRKAWLSSLRCNGTESHIMQCNHSRFSVVPSLKDTDLRGTWLYCFDFNVTDIRLVNGSKSYEGRVELEINGRWGGICTYNMYSQEIIRVGNLVCKQLGYEGMETLLGGNSLYTFWMSNISCKGSETNVADCVYTRGPFTPCFRNPEYLAVQCNDIDECISNPCVNDGSCENGDQMYNCVCPTTWGGINCEIDLNDECRRNPCLNNGRCVDLKDGYECLCEAGFEGDTCLTNTNDCAPSPCLNGGSCEDRVNGFKCYCVRGFDGVNCQLEDESNNSLMVILVSASGGVVVIITLIGLCWCRHRRRKRNNSKTKEVSLGDTQDHAGPNTDEMPKGAESDGYTNLYNSVKENDGTDGIEVYAEIEDVDLSDYLNPVSVVGPKKDEFGYITFGNDENGTVQYYSLQDRKNDEYTQISNSSETKSGKK